MMEGAGRQSQGGKELIRIGKFVLFSASAGIIEICVFTLLNETLHLPYWGSYLTALVCSVLWNFTFNRKFTFKSTANVPVAMLKVALFYAVFTPASTWLEHFYTMTLGWNEYIATGANMALNLITEFLYQRFFVFGKTLDTQPGRKAAGGDLVDESAIDGGVDERASKEERPGR